VRRVSLRYLSHTGIEAATPVRIFVKLPEHVVPVSATVPYTIDKDRTWSLTWVPWPLMLRAAFSLPTQSVCNNPNIRGLTQCTRAGLPGQFPTPGADGTGRTLPSMPVARPTAVRWPFPIPVPATCRQQRLPDLPGCPTGFYANYKLAKGDSLILQVPANGRTVRWKPTSGPAPDQTIHQRNPGSLRYAMRTAQ
jgi:hypothetical protein